MLSRSCLEPVPEGKTIGAYELPYVEQVPLLIKMENSGVVRVRWPDSIWVWALEAAKTLEGPGIQWLLPRGARRRGGKRSCP